MESNKSRILKKSCHKGVSFAPLLLMTQTSALAYKCIKNYLVAFLQPFVIYIPEWILFVVEHVLFFLNLLDNQFEHFVLRPPTMFE